MAKHKIEIGEWVSVYVSQTLIIESDKDIENMSVEQVADLLENDEKTYITSTCRSDYDWTTEDHEEWDKCPNGSYKHLEKIETK